MNSMHPHMLVSVVFRNVIYMLVTTDFNDEVISRYITLLD